MTTGAACASAVCAVTQVTTDNDLPWGLVTLPDGTVLYSRRDAHDIVRLDPTTGAKTQHRHRAERAEHRRRGRPARPRDLARRSPPTTGCTSCTPRPTDNRIVRIKLRRRHAADRAPSRCCSPGSRATSTTTAGGCGSAPTASSTPPPATRRTRDHAQDTNNLNGKVLRINPDGSMPGGQPVRQLRVELRAPQPAGPRVRLAGPAVGAGVRQQRHGRDEPDRQGRQLRLAGVRGHPGDAAAPPASSPRSRPTRSPTGSCSGIAIVRDVLYVACLRGTRLYRAVISGSSLTNVQQFFVGTYGRLRTVEPAPGRRPVADHHQRRRQGQHPEQQQREDPPGDPRRVGAPPTATACAEARCPARSQRQMAAARGRCEAMRAWSRLG